MLSSCHWTGVLVLAPAAVDAMGLQEGAAKKQTGPDPAHCPVAGPLSQPVTSAEVAETDNEI